MNSGLHMLLFCKLDFLLFYMFYSIELKWFNLRNSWVNFLQNFFIRQPPRPHPGNTNWRGGLTTVELPIKVPCFVKKANNVCIMKRSWSKLFSSRRSAVQSLPLNKDSPSLPVKFFWFIFTKIDFFTAINGTIHF